MSEREAVDYTGSLCLNYISYKVWVPDNVTIAMIEGGLVSGGLTADVISKIPSSCSGPFIEYVCSASFPRVVVATTPGTADVQFACKSTCQAMVSNCDAILRQVGKPELIANCDGPIQSTVRTVPPNGILFQPDGKCNVVKPLAASNSTSPAGGFKCPPPFIPVKPGMPPSATCAMLIFASVSTCAWCSALIVNLHLHTVWNSAWLAKKYWLLHSICWGFAITVTAVALGTGQVRWEFATLCLISQEKSSTIFFYPMAAMIFPAFLIHIATFFHIARISAQAGADSETMSRSTLSASAAAVISHRRHVMMAIKIQWRAAVMAICALLCVTFYWLFYFLQLGKINPTELAPHVLTFAACLGLGKGHDACADELAPHLPPYGLMLAAEFLVSSIGTVIFIVFFKMALVREWGDWFSSIGYLCSGKRRQKQEQDQFFVI
ncbi:hypothetical protein BGZ89_009122 [Linnemannia elongata]|nr:hypothetical protein BGZ89_009122 [Linnemannia elongata]